jgi:hypothetical protein
MLEFSSVGGWVIVKFLSNSRVLMPESFPVGGALMLKLRPVQFFPFWGTFDKYVRVVRLYSYIP